MSDDKRRVGGDELPPGDPRRNNMSQDEYEYDDADELRYVPDAPAYDDDSGDDEYDAMSQPKPINNIKDWWASQDSQSKRVWSIGGAVAAGLVATLIFVLATAGGNKNDTLEDGASPISAQQSDTPTSEHDAPDQTTRQRDIGRKPHDKTEESKKPKSTPSPRPKPKNNDAANDKHHDMAPKINPHDQSGDPWANDPQPAAANSPEMDQKASRVSYILDAVVNNPDANLDGFNDVSKKLQAEGMTPGASLQNAYQLMQYMSERLVFVSRASQPDMRAVSKPGVYELQYRVAAAGVPALEGSGQSKDSIRRNLEGQMDDALGAAIGVPVTFTIDFNTNTVNVEPERWW